MSEQGSRLEVVKMPVDNHGRRIELLDKRNPSRITKLVRLVKGNSLWLQSHKADCDLWASLADQYWHGLGPK